MKSKNKQRRVSKWARGSILFWNEPCLKRLKKKCENKHKVQIMLSKIQTCTTDLASYSPTQWQIWQLSLKWLSGARGQGKNKQYYYCFLFFFFYSIMWFKENSLAYIICFLRTIQRGIHESGNEFSCKTHFLYVMD